MEKCFQQLNKQGNHKKIHFLKDDHFKATTKKENQLLYVEVNEKLFRKKMPITYMSMKY